MVITEFSFPEMNSNYSFSFKTYAMHSAEEQKGAEIKALIHCTLHIKSPFRNVKRMNHYSFENRSLNDEFSYRSLLDHSISPLLEGKPRSVPPQLRHGVAVDIPHRASCLHLPQGSRKGFKGKLQTENLTCHQNFLTLKT